MVDSEYTSDNYKSLKLGIGEVIKRLEMLRFVPDQLQAKRLFKNVVTKLPFVIRYVTNRYKTQEMWISCGTLMFVLDC